MDNGGRCRSRSPARVAGAGAGDDTAAAHRLRESYLPPRQSKFRVGALLRFLRPDGSEGTISHVNAEPHDANIRGAICAERAALCQFQRDEAAGGAKITRIVVVTDAPGPIYPGPLCREFFTSVCDPGVEVVASGTKAPGSFDAIRLKELLPLPSVYCRLDQDRMKALGEELSKKVGPPSDARLVRAYGAAVARAGLQTKQATVFPVLFAAAVQFADGRVHAVNELKGIEYGCTVDATSLLLPELQRVREDGGPDPICVVQADQFGVAHAPFAAARSLLIEHGFGSILVSAHQVDGSWAPTMAASDSMPHADYTALF